jgi:hypothetical protein
MRKDLAEKAAKQQEAVRQSENQNVSLGSAFSPSKRSFYQDRLGTNIRKLKNNRPCSRRRPVLSSAPQPRSLISSEPRRQPPQFRGNVLISRGRRGVG